MCVCAGWGSLSPAVRAAKVASAAAAIKFNYIYYYCYYNTSSCYFLRLLLFHSN